MDEDEKNGQGTAPTSGEAPKDDQKPQKKADDTNDSDFDFDKEYERLNSGEATKPKGGAGSKYTPAEKAVNSFKATLRELEKHGVDPQSIMGGGDDEPEDDAPQSGKAPKAVTQADVERIIKQEGEKQRDALMEPIIASKITPITRSQGEAKVVTHWTKKLMADGTALDEAVEIGWFIANRHRFKETFAEITRGKAAEKGKSDGAGAGQKKAAPKTEHSGRESEFAKNRGLVWDDGEGKYISPARKTFLDKQRNPNRT